MINVDSRLTEIQKRASRTIARRRSKPVAKAARAEKGTGKPGFSFWQVDLSTLRVKNSKIAGLY